MRAGTTRPRDEAPSPSGRAGTFALGLVVGLLLVGYGALRAFDLVPRTPPPVVESGPAEQASDPAWRAIVTLGGARVAARLLPLHDERSLEEFRAAALRARYALPEGEPWRLYLSPAEPILSVAERDTSVAEHGTSVAEHGTAMLVIDTAHVGTALVPFADLARAPEGPDPVHALLAAPPGALQAGHARPLVLWGRLPSDGGELELVSGEQRGSARLEPDAELRAPRWYAGDAAPVGTPRSLEAEVARLQSELDRERARRAEREQAFLEFSRLLAELPAGKELGLVPKDVASVPMPPSPEEEARRADVAARRARAEELGRSLSVLMRVEGLRGLDLLDSGTLRDDPDGAIGPVVFRCLDERGALTGSVRAERLRLEASLSAHTLTLVLEDGFESRGGERAPFDGGVRRITLRDVDPTHWLVECPELFDDAGRASAYDDGQWSLRDVRLELNRLLALDTHLGWYRLKALGGVRGSEFVDVQLEEMEASGHLARRLFADRMSIALEDGSVVLDLADGAFVRGEEKQPFRDGRHRIVLVGTPLAEWRKAALPGLAPAPVREPAPAEGARAERSGG